MVEQMFEPLTNTERAAAAEAASAAKADDEWMSITPIPSDAPEIPTHSLGQPSDTDTYRDQDGRPVFHILRFVLSDGSKEHRPLTFSENGRGKRRWQWRALPAPRPLYGLDRLAERPDAPVIVRMGW